MAAEETSKMSEAYPMKSGGGLHSYAKNSIFQRGAIDAAKQVMNEAIEEKLDIGTQLVSSKTFRIADLGCSIGPNTFSAIGNIIEAVKFKYQIEDLTSQIPEFLVFFNDHVANDFNMLFSSLPQDRQYYAAGVPGSFYGRVFPKASLHFVHSSSAIPWLSRVPEDVANKNSPAWNKGQIHYSNSGDEVIRAYKAQYEKDMAKFLQARADEVVFGGLMALIFPGNPNGTPHSQSMANMSMNLIGFCLIDLAQKGIVSEQKVDSFNIPIYFMCPEEFESAVERNGCFSIERMQVLPPVLGNGTLPNAHQYTLQIRAATEALIKQQFGDGIIDELFDLYHKKLEGVLSSMLESGKQINLFVLLKRKAFN